LLQQQQLLLGSGTLGLAVEQLAVVEVEEELI
jgi:hypothetical protein